MSQVNFYLSWAASLAVSIVDRESYGSDRCSVLVLMGVFKFLFVLEVISLSELCRPRPLSSRGAISPIPENSSAAIILPSDLCFLRTWL
jgi:hypothetical protein